MAPWSLRNLQKKVNALEVTDATQVTSSALSTTYVGTGYTDVTYPTSAYADVTWTKSS